MNRPAVRNVSTAMANAATTISGADCVRMFMTSIQMDAASAEQDDEQDG